jgi:hypothetical protein
MKLNLLALRSPDPKRLSGFYELLGLIFEYHRHGNSPYHYSARIDGVVLEIYPLKKDQAEADKHLRLGFTIDAFDKIISSLRANNTFFVSEPADTEFGYCAVAEDPDGRKVELYKSHQL